MRSLAVLVLVLATGCSLLDHQDSDCLGTEVATRFDPRIGQCVDLGGSFTCSCGSNEVCLSDDPDTLDYAACGICAMHDEAACVDQPGCRAQFIENQFSCQGIAPSGALHGSDCTALDAYECSRHDDCTARYLERGRNIVFNHCVDEVHPRP